MLILIMVSPLSFLLQELRDAFNDEGRKVKSGRLLLTMAVPAGQNYIDKGYDVPSITRYAITTVIYSYILYFPISFPPSHSH